MNQYTLHDLVLLYKQDVHDKTDPWGSAMAAYFDVCNELERRGEEVPAIHGYRCSPMEPEDPDEYCVPEMSLEWATDPHVLRRFAECMRRYTEMLRKAGLSY